MALGAWTLGSSGIVMRYGAVVICDECPCLEIGTGTGTGTGTITGTGTVSGTGTATGTGTTDVAEWFCMEPPEEEWYCMLPPDD